MKGIKYVSSCLDYSGYGNSARKNIIALHKANIPVTAVNVSFAANESLIPEEEIGIVKSLINKNIDYEYVIIHLTPENYYPFIENGKINVGHMAWETSKLNNLWVHPCNQMNGMLVPSDWNVEVLKNSGVKVPVYKYPHAYDTGKFDNTTGVDMFDGRYNDRLKFYSIFQWSERKNPEGLLRTYLSTFSADDKVVLVLKTYAGTGSFSDIDFVNRQIARIKNSLNLNNYPPIVFIQSLLKENDIINLHACCDCYLAPVRGEGFGMTVLDASLCGNQVITTNYSAQKEFLDKNLHKFICYTLSPVSNMNWIQWYLGDQMWAEPNNIDFSKKMIDVYSTWKSEKTVSVKKLRQKEFILYKNRLVKYYSENSVSLNLMNTLEEIERAIK